MSFTAQVGETIFLIDRSSTRHQRVILTDPNEGGKIVVANFTDAKYLPGGLVLGPKDCPIFKKPTTVFLPDAVLVDYKQLRAYGAENSGFVADECPKDIVIQIVRWALKSKYTPPDVLIELQRCYRDL